MKRYLILLAILVLLAGMGCDRQQNPTMPEPKAEAKSADIQKLDPAAIKAKSEALEAKLAARRAAHQAEKATKSLAKRSGAMGIEATLVVPDVYATIQDAVDAALPGDQITVKASGSPYTEDVFVSTPDLKIVASGTVTLLGYFDVSANGVSIEKFKIDASVFGLGINANTVSGGKIKNNIIDGASSSFAGIYLIDCANYTVEGNTCSRNFIGIGLLIDDIDPPYSNLFKKNKCWENFAGIELLEAEGNQLIENACNWNSSVGIMLDDSNNNELQENVCNNNGSLGFLLSGTSAGNIIRPDNIAKKNGSLGILLGSDTFNNKVKENTFTMNITCDILDDGTGNVFKNNTFGCKTP